MTTFLEAQVKVSRALKDPGNKFFTVEAVEDLITAGMTEVGRISPTRFQEDITPIVDTLEYQLQTGLFDDATPEIEVARVEIWDSTTTPNRFWRLVAPLQAQPVNVSEAGWQVWDGILRIPNIYEQIIDPDRHLLKVWGYRPYPILTDDGDVLGISFEQEQAVLSYAKIEGLVQILASRDIYTQWQTATGNTDVSPASLNGQLAQERDNWRHKARALAIQR